MQKENTSENNILHAAKSAQGSSVATLNLFLGTSKHICIFYNFPRIILCICPTNERWRYNVTLSLIGWAYTQDDPCNIFMFPKLQFIVTWVNTCIPHCWQQGQHSFPEGKRTGGDGLDPISELFKLFISLPNLLQNTNQHLHTFLANLYMPV